MSYTCKTLITDAATRSSRDKKLSICLAANGFSFAETDPSHHLCTFGEVVGTHAFTMTGVMADLKTLFAEIGLRPLGYASMELIVLSDISTWVPDELYSSLSNRHYLNLLGGSAEGILTCHSQALQSTAVFAANEQVVTAFKVAMPGISVMHQHAKLSRLASTCADHPLIVCNLRQGRADVAAFNDGRYVFGNTLHYSSVEESVYALVEAMKSLEIEHDNTELRLCGDVDRAVFSAYRPYFPHTTLYSPIDPSQLSSDFNNFPTYRYALLFI